MSTRRKTRHRTAMHELPPTEAATTTGTGDIFEALAYNVARVGRWSADLRLDRVEWSEAARGLFGIERGLEPRSAGEFFELVHADDRARVASVVQTAIDTDSTDYDITFRIRTGDSSSRMVRVQAQVLRDGRVGAESAPEAHHDYRCR